MSSLNSAGPLGNIMSRLAGLKNVGSRRVMPGAEFLQELEDVEPDVSGTSTPLPNFANFQSPVENLPEEDLGGELTPQSYDVRANSAQPPEEKQDTGFFSRLGQALSDYVNPQKREEMGMQNKALLSRAQGIPTEAPSIETAQVDMQEGLPPVNAAEEEAPQEPSFWRTLANEATKPYHGLTAPSALEGATNYLKENFIPKIAPETYEQFNLEKPPELMQQEQQQKQVDQSEIDAAQMEPWQVAAYGATDAFANNPELVSEVQQYTGINFDEREKELTEKYEKVLTDLQKGNTANDANYDEQEMRIKERILGNQSNDSDKYYIGLALMMPLLIGGLFGKEAALGALGGGAKGIADVFKGRQENIKNDEELLGDIYKQRSVNDTRKGELEIEKMKIPEAVKKILPKDEFEDIKGMDIISYKDPATGEVVASGPEVLPDLVLDMKYANNPKKRDRAEKEAEKLAEEKSALERANQATSDVIKAAMQLKDAGIMSKILAFALSEEKNDSLKKLVKSSAPDIMVDGRKQNAAVYIDSKIEQLKDAYRRNEQMKAFTATVANHITNMAENPLYSGLKPSDLIDQMLIMRDRGQSFFVDRASAQGFLTQPLQNKFGKLNRELYKGLNKKEEQTQLERDKQLMYGT